MHDLKFHDNSSPEQENTNNPCGHGVIWTLAVEVEQQTA